MGRPEVSVGAVHGVRSVREGTRTGRARSVADTIGRCARRGPRTARPHRQAQQVLSAAPPDRPSRGRECPWAAPKVSVGAVHGVRSVRGQGWQWLPQCPRGPKSVRGGCPRTKSTIPSYRSLSLYSLFLPPLPLDLLYLSTSSTSRPPLPLDLLYLSTSSTSRPPLPLDLLYLSTSSTSRPPLPLDLLYLSTSSTSRPPLPLDLLYLSTSSTSRPPLPLDLLYLSTPLAPPSYLHPLLIAHRRTPIAPAHPALAYPALGAMPSEGPECGFGSRLRRHEASPSRGRRSPPRAGSTVGAALAVTRPRGCASRWGRSPGPLVPLRVEGRAPACTPYGTSLERARTRLPVQGRHEPGGVRLAPAARSA